MKPPRTSSRATKHALERAGKPFAAPELAAQIEQSAAPELSATPDLS